MGSGIVKNIIRTALAMAVGVSLIGGGAVFTHAAAAITVKIPVSQKYSESGDIPSDLNRKFNYELTSAKDGNPMPANAKFTLEGNASTNLEISYSKPGVYEYLLKQVITSQISRMNYDRTEYKVQVVIKNDGNGGLISSLYVSKRGSTYKTDKAEFSNSYTGSTTPGTSSSSSSSSSTGRRRRRRSSTTTTNVTTNVTVGGGGAPAQGVLGERMAPEGGAESGVLGERMGPDSGVLGERNAPNTGDDSEPILWMSIILISIIIIGFAFRKERKEKR